MASATTMLPRTNADGDALCPLRPGQGCNLCFPGASSPQNCGRVYLVMSDPELRAQLTEIWSAFASFR